MLPSGITSFRCTTQQLQAPGNLPTWLLRTITHDQFLHDEMATLAMQVIASALSRLVICNRLQGVPVCILLRVADKGTHGSLVWVCLIMDIPASTRTKLQV